MNDEDELTMGDMGDIPPGMVRFMGRLMNGYESMARRQTDLVDTLSEQLRAARENETKAIEMRLQLVHEVEQLSTQRQKRELDAQHAAQRSEAFAAITADVRSLGTVVVKKMLGVPLSGDDSHGLQDFLNSLSEAQQQDLFMNGKLELNPGQRVALAELLSSLAKEEAEKAKRLEASKEATANDQDEKPEAAE